MAEVEVNADISVTAVATGRHRLNVVARRVPDDTLEREARRGSWKLEVNDNYEGTLYRSWTVFPGDGVDDLDRVIRWALTHPRGEVCLITENFGRWECSIKDLVAMRRAFEQAYGPRDKINVYAPLETL
jgi:hypothetical protein